LGDHTTWRRRRPVRGLGRLALLERSGLSWRRRRRSCWRSCRLCTVACTRRRSWRSCGASAVRSRLLLLRRAAACCCWLLLLAAARSTCQLLLLSCLGEKLSTLQSLLLLLSSPGCLLRISSRVRPSLLFSGCKWSTEESNELALWLLHNRDVSPLTRRYTLTIQIEGEGGTVGCCGSATWFLLLLLLVSRLALAGAPTPS